MDIYALFYFVPAIRLVLGLYLITTAILKFPRLKYFSTIVMSYGVLPRNIAKAAAYTHPFFEFAIGWWVLYGKPLLHSGLAAFLLLSVIEIIVLLALLKNKKLQDCGCYAGFVKVPLNWEKFWTNMILIILSLILVVAGIQLQLLIA